MKIKKTLLVATILSLGIAFTGCVSDKIKDVSSKTVQEKIIVEKYVPLQNETINAKDHWVFNDIKDVIEDGFVSQAMINVQLQDIFFVKTTDTEAVVKVLEEYKNQSLRLFAGGYGGEQNASAVANSVLKTEGNYVYFIATQNTNAIEKELLKIIK